MRGMKGIVDQLHRSLEGDSWQGASIREILEDLTAREAAAHPVPGAHSIWELVYHVTAWVGAVHSRVLGNVCEPAGEGDWPPVRDTGDNAWTAALEDLRRSQSELIATLETLSDADLDAPVPNRDYDRAHLLHGLAQHHAYHAGQMALLKRASRHQATKATPP
jgi:uncharacterized damage-inducible protein DinB